MDTGVKGDLADYLVDTGVEEDLADYLVDAGVCSEGVLASQEG